nr:hypothetical protein [Cytophagales bacterium]
MKNSRFFKLLTLCSLAPFSAAFANGQSVPINYDNLSFFEEPLAVEIGPATLNGNFLIDQAAEYNFTSDNDTYNTRAVGRVRLETELPNTVQVAAEYVGRYDRLADNDENDEYTDDFAFFIYDEWGSFAAGNVTETVHENTRRTRGFGNADLENDDFLGTLDETGASYSVRYNSYEVSLAADQEGHAEAGLTFEQPIGKSVYYASARLRKGDTAEGNGTSDEGDTLGTAIVGQYVYATFLIATQLGYETVDVDVTNDKNDHFFGSLGVLYKYGAYRFSAEGSLGDYDGDERRAFALGSRIDVARGVSLNTGVNYSFVNDTDNTTALTSIRYEF